MSWRYLWIIVILSCAGPFARAADGIDFFEKKIRPVLVAECYKCHSAQSEKLKANLRLDTREGALKGGESGKPAVTPGDVEKSVLIEAIRQTNPDLQMPPKRQLPAAVVKDFEEWVRLGAPDPRGDSTTVAAAKDPKNHWSFKPLRTAPPPAVKD